MTAPAGYHERDCAPCTAAREVVGALAVELDPLDNWPDVEVGAGVTVEKQLLYIAAGVLHRFPLPAVKPAPTDRGWLEMEGDDRA